MRHSLLSPGLILGVSTGAYAAVPSTQPRSPGPYCWNLSQITMTQYASGATSPLGALITKRLLLALAALFALFVVPAFAEVPYVQGCSSASTGWLTERHDAELNTIPVLVRWGSRRQMVRHIASLQIHRLCKRDGPGPACGSGICPRPIMIGCNQTVQAGHCLDIPGNSLRSYGLMSLLPGQMRGKRNQISQRPLLSLTTIRIFKMR